MRVAATPRCEHSSLLPPMALEARAQSQPVQSRLRCSDQYSHSGKPRRPLECKALTEQTLDSLLPHKEISNLGQGI